MQITRQSMISGETNTLDLPVTCDQLASWQGGGRIQKVFPHLLPWEREFIVTGITREEWETAFPPEPEDDA